MTTTTPPKAAAAFGSEQAARIFREAQNAYVRRLARKSKNALVDEYNAEMEAQGYTLILGGPYSKNDLISALSELRYPVARLNESTHVLYHQDGGSSACEFCHAMCNCCSGLVSEPPRGEHRECCQEVHAWTWTGNSWLARTAA